jgi:hypothetical protein
VRPRIAKTGDLWKPLVSAKGRTDLGKFLTPPKARRSASAARSGRSTP